MTYKYFFLLCTISLCFACGSTKKTPKPDFEIAPTTVILEKDTLQINELRFYKIESSLDAIRMMRKHYGNYHKSITGKHQDNIQREIWDNITLFEGDDSTFTVIADGTETQTDYYACLMVFDDNDNNCFNSEHPYKEKLMQLFNGLMDKNKP